jgi:hypothetical protein
MGAESAGDGLRAAVEAVRAGYEQRATQTGGDYEAAVRRSVCRSVVRDLRAALDAAPAPTEGQRRVQNSINRAAANLAHIAGATTEGRAGDGVDAEARCKCGHSAWVDHGGIMSPPAGCDECFCTLNEEQAAAGVNPIYSSHREERNDVR